MANQTLAGMQMGSAWPPCTLLEPQLVFWEVLTRDEFSSALKKAGKAAWSSRKSLSGVSLKVSISPELWDRLSLPGQGQSQQIVVPSEVWAQGQWVWDS